MKMRGPSTFVLMHKWHPDLANERVELAGLPYLQAHQPRQDTKPASPLLRGVLCSPSLE